MGRSAEAYMEQQHYDFSDEACAYWHLLRDIIKECDSKAISLDAITPAVRKECFPPETFLERCMPAGWEPPQEQLGPALPLPTIESDIPF